MDNYPRLRFTPALEGERWHTRVGIVLPSRGEVVIGVYWAGYRPVFFPRTYPTKAVYAQVYELGLAERLCCTFVSSSEARRFFKARYQRWRADWRVNCVLEVLRQDDR
jgi:hypothetical protein